MVYCRLVIASWSDGVLPELFKRPLPCLLVTSETSRSLGLSVYVEKSSIGSGRLRMG